MLQKTKLGPPFTFQQENGPKYPTGATIEWLQSKHFHAVVRPSQRLELNLLQDFIVTQMLWAGYSYKKRAKISVYMFKAKTSTAGIAVKCEKSSRCTNDFQTYISCLLLLLKLHNQLIRIQNAAFPLAELLLLFHSKTSQTSSFP